MECTKEKFEAIFHEYRPRLEGFFRTLGARPDTREDLVQATFGNAAPNLGKVNDETHLERWLLRIARNLWHHEQRKSNTHKRTGVEVTWEEAESVSSGGAATSSGSGTGESPLDRLLAQEEQSLVRQAVAQLPDQMKRCVILFYFKGNSIEEIAKIMRLQSGTVKSHLGQARQKLKGLLR